MPRTAFLRTCSLMFLSSILDNKVFAQLPFDASVSTVVPDSKLHKDVLTLRQRERFLGTLLLCGGGTIPLAIREEFYVQGKGAEGTLVLIPTASPRSDAGDFSTWIDYWSGFRWENVEVLHVANRYGAHD